MGFPINPPRTALSMPDGTCSPEWYRFFVNIQKVIGGPSDPFIDNFLLGAPDQRAIAEPDVTPMLLPPAVPPDVQALLNDITRTQGSVIYRGASLWAALAPGTSGQLLTTMGAAANPQWSTYVTVTDGDKGDITVASSGTSWTIDNNVVTFAKMQDITTDRLIGRDTAGTGDPELISLGGGLEWTGSASIQTSAFTGDVTKTAGGTALTIANDAVTYAKLQNISATDRLLGRDTAGSGDTEELTVGNGLEFTGSGGIGVANDGITYARMQNVSAASKLLGRGDSGSGDPQEITLGAGLTMTGTTLSASGGGGGGLSDGDYGDITVSGSGTVMNIDAGVVGPTELANTAVTPGSYTKASITVDQQGRLTAASTGTFRGALVSKTADETTANYSSNTAIPWTSESYDTDTIHDTVTNNSRLSVPNGVTKVIVKGQVHLTSVTTSDACTVRVGKNGAVDTTLGLPSTVNDTNTATRRINVVSPVLSVTGGTDYFELFLVTGGDTSITVEADSSWFSMEIVE